MQFILKKILLSLLSLIIGSALFELNAQTPETDSLENVIQQYNNEDTIRVNLLNEVAYKLYSINIDKTFKYAKEAGELADKTSFAKGKAESLRLLGIYYDLRGDNLKSLDYYQKSLEIYEELNNRSGISKSYNNIGGIYVDLYDYPKSLEYYQKSLKIRYELNDKKGIAWLFNNIGVTYGYMGNYSKALEYNLKSLKIQKELNNLFGIALSCSNTGKIFTLQGNYPEALKYYQKSLKICRKAGIKSAEGECYKGLGVLYLKQNDAKKAYDYSKKAYVISKETGEILLQKESSELLAKSSAALGLYKDACKYHLIFKTMSDSLFNAENVRKLAGIEYENEKQTIELEQQRKDAIHTEKEKQQKIIRNSFLVGLVLMIIIALVVFNGFINKRKANRVLALQNLEIEEINEELTQQKDEIETQAENLAIANEKLQELNATKDKFFSIIAHDLRSPFSALMVYSDLLLENHKEYDEEEREDMIKSISDSSRNTFRLLENLLTWSRSQSGMIEFLPKKIKIKPFIDEIILLLQQTAINKNISLSSDIDIDMCIYADENMISTVLRNFITNAIKFTRKNGTVIVSANETNKSGFIEISVRDTGVGISKDKINNLFYIDKNISTLGTEDETGTGLGLILCKEFVEKNNGKISVESEVGKGSKFTFVIPQSI